MKTFHVFLLLLSSVSIARAAVTLEWVNVGDAGNANDTTGFGGVAYGYQIMKYEVTNAQYAEFLNTVDAAGTNPNGIWNSNMGSNARGGISFTAGNAAGSKYAVKTDMGDKPVNYVSFSDSMRFANWIHNGQGAGSTESGAYDMTVSASTVIHSGLANVWLPTANEWYKAAYYQPVGAGGDTDSYWRFSTASNTVPTVATSTITGTILNPGANVANYGSGADWNGQDGNVTTVGSAGLLSASYYGTFDQSGNVQEWTEAISGGNRGLRGGSWNLGESIMRSTNISSLAPNNESSAIGFRLASAFAVPEPSRVMLALAGVFGLLMRRRRLLFAR